MSKTNTVLYTDIIRQRLIHTTSAIRDAVDATALVQKINGVRINDKLRYSIEEGCKALYEAQKFFNQADALNAEQAKADRACKDKQQADENLSPFCNRIIAEVKEALASTAPGSDVTITEYPGVYTVTIKTS
jgi:hypothetical protein